MSRFVHHEQCPKCALRGGDRRGNNLGVWADGARYCFSCGYQVRPTYRSTQLNNLIGETDDKAKAVLPSDFSREIPGEAWQWLLQYNIPMSYWKTYCGYSEKDKRLIFTVGTPTKFSIGRAINPTMGASKWKVYGDKSSYVEVINEQIPEQVVLVEDLISAHKVGLAGFTAIPLFGTSIGDIHIKKLQALGRPVSLWLDQDQYSLLAKKIGRLQSLVGASVRHITTRLDPKCLSTQQIKEELRYD